MLEPLDPRKLYILSLEGYAWELDDIDPLNHFWHIRLKMEENWAHGVKDILRTVGGIQGLVRHKPLTWKEEDEVYLASDEWWIELAVRALCLTHGKRHY